MHTLTEIDLKNVLSLLNATRQNLDRVERLLVPEAQPEDDLDPRNPLNKAGLNLTPRGAEVCYRLFDQGKSRYAIAQAMDISYGAATHRYHAWEKLGGKDRQRQALD